MTAKLTLMQHVLHLSAECYPAAKVGGLADVVGALPKYQKRLGWEATVLMPGYQTPWIVKQAKELVYQGIYFLGNMPYSYAVEKVVDSSLGYNLLLMQLPGRFDRPGVYNAPDGSGYHDEVERNMSFQLAALTWLLQSDFKPNIIHCHDHHTGLIPFMMTRCPVFRPLSQIPTIFTIHNGQYHGAFSWNNHWMIPEYDHFTGGLMEWGGIINPLASAIRCCWRLTTVSNAYLHELTYKSNGLEPLVRQELGKSSGVLNGIDAEVWNPETDPMLPYHYHAQNADNQKLKIKIDLCKKVGLSPSKILFAFIGRLVGEKGADLLPGIIYRFLREQPLAAFVVLGSGMDAVENSLINLSKELKSGTFSYITGYNEPLAHQIYAGADFLFMPSRVEPCGLNQLYALRYGTIPIVRNTGGLHDTVPDIDQTDGYGIRFNDLNTHSAVHALHRAMHVYAHPGAMPALRKHIMNLDFSWERATQTYLNIYQSCQ